MSIDEKIIEAKKLLGDILDKNFGSKKWDINYDDRDTEKVVLILHFPKITITNSQGLEHEILDLYVKTGLFVTAAPEVEGGIGVALSPTLWGMRTTRTLAEACSQYMHSHLPGRSSGHGTHWDNFCLGAGDGPMPSALNALAMPEDYDPLLFEVFLYQLQKYVRWESIEGIPYMYMKDIRDPTPSENLYDIAIEDTNKIIELYKKDKITLPIDYEIHNNRAIKLKLDEHHPSFINLMDEISIYQGYLDVSGTKFTTYSDPIYKLKYYLKLESWVRMPRDGNGQRVVTFKGIDLYNRVLKPKYDHTPKEEINKKTVASPTVIRKVAKKINDLLLKHSYERKKELYEDLNNWSIPSWA